MSFGTQIAYYRKQHTLTQEALAQRLGVTNQAVSKWESDQCFPDVTFLPKLADLFGISIDELFGRPAPGVKGVSPFPWPDDEALRVVIFMGHRLLDGHPAAKEITFHYEGPARSIDSAFSVTCEDVEGNITAGSAVNCADVDGNVQAGGNVNCGDIGGDLKAGGNARCGDVAGNVIAGGTASCGDVIGCLYSGNDVMSKNCKDMPAEKD